MDGLVNPASSIMPDIAQVFRGPPNAKAPPKGRFPFMSTVPRQSLVWVSLGTSEAPAEPRPESEGFSMKKRWQLNENSPSGTG